MARKLQGYLSWLGYGTLWVNVGQYRRARAGAKQPAEYFSPDNAETRDEREGFAKAVVDRQTRRILGFHVVGPHASLLIPEVANAVMRGERVEAITDCMHIFPALSDLVTETFSNLA